MLLQPPQRLIKPGLRRSLGLVQVFAFSFDFHALALVGGAALKSFPGSAAGRVMTKASCRRVAAECYVAVRVVAPISPVAVRGPDSRLILHESEGRDRIRTRLRAP
jgi:hypothetical protein